MVWSTAGWAVAGAIDGNDQTGWAVMPRFGEPHVGEVVPGRQQQAAPHQREAHRMRPAVDGFRGDRPSDELT